MDHKEVVRIDQDFIWHPYSILGVENKYVQSAKGALIRLNDNTEIIDAISSWWVNLHGHSNDYITNALKKQLEDFQQVIFSGFTHKPAIELIKLLDNLIKDKYRYFFSDNGSTAVETALKLVIKYWENQGQPRKKFLAIQNAYHGDTFGAMSVSYRGVFNSIFKDLLFDTDFIPVPDGSGKALDFIQKNKVDYAGFIFEPMIQGAGGMVFLDKQELSEVIKVCQENRILCIADEVFTGFYRTGLPFAYNHLNIKPDLICLSKALTSGYCSMGMTCISENISKSFLDLDYSKSFFHGHSYTGNALSAIVAKAALELCLEPDFKTNILRIEKSHQSFVNELLNFPNVKNPRSLGLILAFDLDFGEKGYLNPVRDKIVRISLENGVLLRPLGNVIYVVPPVCITDKELNQIYKALKIILTEI